MLHSLRQIATLVIANLCIFISLYGQSPTILVFSKTAGFRHDAIGKGIETFKKIGAENGYKIVATEDASEFREENLKEYRLIVFLNTTGDVLDRNQQVAFERFIQAGGSYLGVHAATDTEYTWPWYNGLVGAYFLSHPNRPNVRKAQFDKVGQLDHISTKHMPLRFELEDEFYNFKSIKKELIKPLITIDETTYVGGANGTDHPMSWYHEYDGGKAFYTALGHTNEMYDNPLFLDHLKGAIQYLLGEDKTKKLDYTKARSKIIPESNRFSKEILAKDLKEPVELAVLPDERVLFIERLGAVKLYDPITKQTKLIHQLEVSHKYKFKDNSRDEAEDGLLGLALDPNFAKNGWFYMYFSKPGTKPVNILTRWDFNDEKLDEKTMKVVLEVDVQRENCCHTGGSIAFDKQGNLYLSTGDNTSPRATKFAPIDERKDRFPFDAQKGSANTNDLRGKILRISPKDDGTYTIPTGNLFPVGTEGTRPEIYGMGMRNPYRISVDQKSGYVYWGDVGPDAAKDSVGLGPMGYDEFNQMRKPGFFGWPYFIGENRAYNEVDYMTNVAGGAYNPEKPVNNSPNNTGLNILPQAQPAFIEYSYAASEKYPLLGTGGRTAMAGPVYYSDLYKNSKSAFPDYYDGKLFIYEWMRDWVMAVSMDKEGNYIDMERFAPDLKLSNPSDMEMGPNGDMYVLEYGKGWFQGNPEASLAKISYTAGNRKPTATFTASKTHGAIPLKVDLNSDETIDYDGDKLVYEWKLFSPKGILLSKSTEKNSSFLVNNIGKHKIVLSVTDQFGLRSEYEQDIAAGNEPPKVDLQLKGANSTFFFPDKAFTYDVKVNDKEDGKIKDEDVAVTIDYLKEGYDKIEVAQGHVAADEFTRFSAGKLLINGADCNSCHKTNAKSIGPSYVEVAKKYKDVAEAQTYISKKIIEGGSGVWGSVSMSAHPNIKLEDSEKISRYILSLSETPLNQPLSGNYTVKSKDIVEGQGAVILRAAYKDQGANGMPSLQSQKILTLKNPKIKATTADEMKDVSKVAFGEGFMIGTVSGGWMSFKSLDLTNVNGIKLQAAAPKNFGFVGGYAELRLGSPTGEIIGKSPLYKAVEFAPGPTTALPLDKIVFKKLVGKHDLYIVFKNDDIKEGSLFTVSNFEIVSD